jgi:Niemann-Pick C1 protein
MAEGLFSRCPACFFNFRQFWCTFTCSPEQARFVTVLQSSVCNATQHPGASGRGGCAGSPSWATGLAGVQRVLVQVDAAYAAALFDSCRAVTVAATGQPAMQLAFGRAASAADFLRFQGLDAYAAGQSPIQILFNLSLSYPPSSSGGGVLNATAESCGTERGDLACTCGDCQAACPPPPPPPPPPWLPAAWVLGVRVDAAAAGLCAAYLALAAAVYHGLLRKEPAAGRPCARRAAAGRFVCARLRARE